MTSTRIRPSQDPDEYLYQIDSYRDRFDACDSPEGSMGRQYENIILQALPSEYDRIRQNHLEMRDSGLADIRRMVAAIYADNLSRSESSKGVAGRRAAMKAMDRDRTSVLLHILTATNLGISKENAYSESNASSSSSSRSSQFGIISNNNMVNISKSRPGGGKTTVEAMEAVCGVHITRQRLITTPTVVSNSTKPAATLMWPPPELSASKKSTAPTTCPRRMTIQNSPTSPSGKPTYKARQSRRQRPGRRSIQGPRGRAGLITSPRDRLRRNLCPRVQGSRATGWYLKLPRSWTTRSTCWACK